MRFNGVTENKTKNSEPNTKGTPEQFVYIWNISSGKRQEFGFQIIIINTNSIWSKFAYMEHEKCPSLKSKVLRTICSNDAVCCDFNCDYLTK